VTAASVLGFGAACAAVLGAWEAVAAIERAPLLAALAGTLSPALRAGREGRSPTAPERRRLAVVAAATLAAGGWLLGGAALAAVAGVAGPAVAIAAVRARRRRYAAELRREAPAAARAIADALAAGHAVRGAIGVVGEALPGAAGHELRTTARAMALGEPTEAALERLRRRAAGAAWDAIVAGILLQREAGGDLVALLRDLAWAQEAHARQERDAEAATSQARFTARLVAGLPVAVAVLAELASPGFVAGLLANPVSAWLAGLAVLLEGAALLGVRWIARGAREGR
jgi:tight adherence protein B